VSLLMTLRELIITDFLFPVFFSIVMMSELESKSKQQTTNNKQKVVVLRGVRFNIVLRLPMVSKLAVLLGMEESNLVRNAMPSFLNT